jgi:hypothetical protein
MSAPGDTKRLGLAMVVAPAPAQAATGNVTCTTLISVTVITGNVTVPAGASCILVGGTVQGNVSAGAGASLELDSVTVQGNVFVGAGASFDAGGTVMRRNLSTEGANTINIVFSEVDGNSSFDATSGPLSICGGGGSACVLFNFNPGTASKFGNVSITNTSSPAGAVYGGNFVAGNLTCSGNTFVTNNVPGFGSIPNTVLGHESGQCVGL